MLKVFPVDIKLPSSFTKPWSGCLKGTVTPSITTSVGVKVLTPFLLTLVSPVIFSTPGIVDKLLST